MPLDQTLTKPELVLDMLESMRDVLLGTSPLAAEVEVSLGTIGWFLTAPDFARGSFDDHPFERCAAMPSMRLLSEEIDTFPEHDDVALALNRVLASLQPNEPELRDAARANELILLDRGAQAPEWTTQLDRWELTEAWQLSEAAPTGLGARLASVLGWRHPCGEEHCLIVDSDPRSYDHIEAIGSFDSTREVVAQIRSELAELGPDAPIVLEPADRSELGSAIRRSIAKTYLHDLARLREDLPSLALFALLESRCNLLR